MIEINRNAIVVITITTLVVSLALTPASAVLSAAACKAERRAGILKACKAVLLGQPPSAQCCERIREIHVECVCPLVTPQYAALIDVNRAVKIVQGCGRRVPRHFKCGSVTTP